MLLNTQEGVISMNNGPNSTKSNSSAKSDRANRGWTRRQLMGASLIGAGFAGGGSTPLKAEIDDAPCRPGQKIIDGHVHLWKLPRNAPPMSDFATFPTGCCGSVPWMEVDRLIPDYNARVGGPEVDKVVLIESSVGVPPDKIIQSNLWMLQEAAAESKILSVVGNLDVTQAPASFALQVAQLAANKQWVGIRIGGGIFQPNTVQFLGTLKPNVLTNLTLLAKRGLEIDTLGITGAALSQIGGAVPGLIIVMDHFAGKPTTFDVEDSWKADMIAAASYHGLNVKVSDVHKLSAQVVTGHPAGLTQFQPIADPTRYAPTLEFLFRTFGDDRLIFGTNWPVSDAGGLFVDSIDLEINILESFLTGRFSGGLEKIMYQNALRVYSPRK
jgi:L-fucono-1,5-lactonase